MHDLAPWRRRQGLKQEDLAHLIGVDVSTIKRWERGETVPYAYNLEKLLGLGFQPDRHAPEDGALLPTSASRERPSLQHKSGASLNEKQEHPSTYVVQDRSNQEELTRLLLQDRMITAGMGGVLPEQLDVTRFQRLLDIGCGPGGWLLDVAQQYPHLTSLIGVDISGKMIDYAREQASAQQVSDRVEFLVMDALRMLEFPDAFFDGVHMRFAHSFLRVWDWPKLLLEVRRILKPGGLLLITETTLTSTSTSPASSSLKQLLAQALTQAGHVFPEGIIEGLPRMLRQHHFEPVRTHLLEITYHAGTPEGDLLIEDLKRIYRTAAPFLRKWVRLPENYEELYQHMLQEVRAPDFVVQWPLITLWCTC